MIFLWEQDVVKISDRRVRKWLHSDALRRGADVDLTSLRSLPLCLSERSVYDVHAVG